MPTKNLDFSSWSAGFLCECDETLELSPDKCICPMFGIQGKASGALGSFSMNHKHPGIRSRFQPLGSH